VARVVIIGGGFAGLAAAKRLASAPVEVILVDQHNYHTFQPLLYQVATAGLEPADVAYPIRSSLARGLSVSFHHGQAVELQLERRLVVLKDSSELTYDFLIIASGAAANFFGLPGAKNYSRALYTLADARRLRNQLLETLEQVDAHPEKFNDGAPVFVVVGGGPTGVEIAGAISELLDIAVRHDKLRINRGRTRVILTDAQERLLSAFEERAGSYAEETLRSRGVEVLLGRAVSELREGCVCFADGSTLESSLTVWAGGMTVDGTLAATVPGARSSGKRVVVREDLSLPGFPEVFVVGDAAAVPLVTRDTPLRTSTRRAWHWVRGDSENVSDGMGGQSGGMPELCPQLAQVAIQSGTHAADQVLNRLAGRVTKRFVYRDKGMMATIGRRAAVTQLHSGIVVRGTLGWLAWLLLHLVYLIGFRNRLKVLINWCWRYLDWPSGPRLIVADAETEG
jgi:NADH dehydrogenase